MAKPNPQVGLVIRYEYLWKSEEQAGLSKGEKHRPCAIILVPTQTIGQPLKAMVCAITHSEPRGDDIGIEVPDNEKASMGLDSRRQWIIASEANLTDWDDPGVVEMSHGSWVCGVVPRVLLDAVRVKYMAVYRERGAADTVINRPTLCR